MTARAQIYVNEDLKGSSPWTGSLAEGNYQIEARLAGHRSQKQSVALAEKERRNVELPELTAITGSLNIDYKPLDSEVWLDGKKIGVSPDVFRNILVGNHSVEVRANGCISDNKTIAISEGQTTLLSGELKANAITSSSNAIVPSSNATASLSNATVPVPDAVDLGLSVKYKWTKVNGITGIRVTGPNGKRIFFPASQSDHYSNGYVGYFDSYWSASVDSRCKEGILLELSKGYKTHWTYKNSYMRANGFLVRPVLAE